MVIMPWVKRTSTTNRFYWIVAAVASVIVGVSAGYSWWGDTASVVTIVEQELANSQAQVRMLEKRVKALEAKLGIDSETAAVTDQSVKAY
jgi:hypothetical protein